MEASLKKAEADRYVSAIKRLYMLGIVSGSVARTHYVEKNDNSIILVELNLEFKHKALDVYPK